ncbi:CD9 antigen isoform X1 [Periophthalmus magnuspinnatus]|uniref:CD9 antigen isoform X1 n=1 Tax=Periophthalmus magnuspinnatus TaxID=409849 RepID=UPI00145AA8D7|nr:CD9 antigen isoform X1 [Periophthalmus magnuspinnatus]
MAVDGCGLVCKYIIILFDCIFAVAGIGFLGLGLWLRFSNNTRAIFEIQELNSSTFVIGVTVLIVLGSVMLIVVTFGDYGACSEKRCSLQVFSCLVAILAGAEIIIGVLAYTNHDEVGKRTAEFYTSLYGVYVATGDPAVAVTLTFVQKMLHCCGVSGIPLVDLAKKTCPAPNTLLENLKMPNCPSTISTFFDEKAPVVLGIFLGTGALLITALICSSTLAKKIRLAAASPQYIILSSTTSSSNPPHPHHTFYTSSSYPTPDQEPVVFTPLSVANLPVTQP